MRRFLWLLGFMPAFALGQPADGSVARPDLTLHYTCIGQGTPLLILSGGPGLEVVYMDTLSKPLSEHNRCIMLEQRGTGRSQPAKVEASTYSLDSYVEDLEALRLSLHLGQFNVLGHSWGGILAMAYAAKYPTHVHSMVLLSSASMNVAGLLAISDIIEHRLTSDQLKDETYWSSDAQVAKNPELAATKALAAVTPAYFYDAKMGVSFAAQIGNFHIINPGVIDAAIGSLIQTGYDLRVRLTAYHGPCFISQGTHDVIGDDTARQIHDTIYGSQLLVIDKCGHFEWIEQPRVLMPALEAFLKATTSPPPDELDEMDSWAPMGHFHGHGRGR
jgi:proline iminopeptidase